MRNKFLIIFLSLALTFALLEGLCWLGFQKNIKAIPISGSDLYYHYDLDGRRRQNPNSTGFERLWDNSGKTAFRINSLGLRGPDVEIPKPSGRTRLFFLGDSITLGGRLPEDTTFVSRVQQIMNAPSSKYETINGGVGDVGLEEETALLKEVGLQISPDLLVLCWYLNDGRPPVGFKEEVLYQDPIMRWANRYHIPQKSYFLSFLYNRYLRMIFKKEMNLQIAWSQRFDWIEAYNTHQWVKSDTAFSDLVSKAKFDWGDAWNVESVKKMAAQIRQIKLLAEKEHAKFAVVLLPVQAQVYSEASQDLVTKPQRLMRSALLQQQIPTLDLLPDLKTWSKEPLFYDQCHYTPHGNERVAQRIVTFLIDSKLVTLHP